MENQEIYKALGKFQGSCPEIKLDAEVKIAIKKKDGSFGEISFKYASLGNIIKTIRPTLKECGLSFSHLVGTPGVKCILMHESGDLIESDYFEIPKSTDLKQMGASITYARRYTLVPILGLFADDDKDAPLQEQGKKQISDKAFDQAVERILGGDPNVFIQVLMMFSVTEDQMTQLYELSLNKFGTK
jgi:hypothetical protein